VKTEATDGPFRQPRVDWYLALGIGLVAFVLYLLTVQRTVSFWDCGEFIACAVILGVPHPPGTPLFVLVGRLFSLLPTAADISLRVNLVSVVSGALSVGLAYLLGARLLRRWILNGLEFWGRELVVFTGAACGAMLFGFAATVWSNAVEAEVYGITLAIFVTIVYTGLVWIDWRYTPLGPRLLFFMSYMAVFGLGVHLMPYLAVPGLWLVVFLFHGGYRRDWRVWAGALAMMLVVATGTEAFMWNLTFLLGLGAWWLLAPAVNRRIVGGWIAPIWAVVLFILFEFTLPLTMFQKWGWGTFDWLTTIAIFLASFVGSFLARHEDPVSSRRRWGLMTGIVGSALLAFSLQGYIPVRAGLNPRINENHPDNWEAFKGFLERKQYGQESMVERMFTRRGLWQNQLGRHPRMGFWGFFEEQYSLRGTAFILLFLLGLVPFVLPFLRRAGGGVGAYPEWIPDRYAVQLFLFLTLLATTIGLVVYMNFADGVFYNPNASDQAYLEVRDRDYFFTTGFALFGLCIGLGAAWITAYLASRSRDFGRPLVTALCLGAFVLLPYATVKANWYRNDRSRNFLPYDYAYNILMSCPQNTILFTNGDNDTFPVWCLQEAYGVRRDVRVVNLSLVNTDWYILQMKNQFNVPMNLTDDQIRTRPERLSDGRVFGKPIQPFMDRFRGYQHDLVPYIDQEGTLVRVQDQMIEQIVLANAWRDPVMMTGSYSGETKLDLPNHSEMVGQNYRIVRSNGLGRIDLAESRRLYDSVYAYRSFADSSSYQDESATSLLWAYPEKMLQVSERYLAAADTAGAAHMAEKAREVLPAYWRTYDVLSELYSRLGRPADSARAIDAGITHLTHLRRVNPSNVLYTQAHAFVLEIAGRPQDGLDELWRAFLDRPKEEMIFLTLARFAMNAGDGERIRRTAEIWLEAHPNDERARQLLSYVPRSGFMPPTTPAEP
jgi:hypothetical protein